MRIKSRKMLGVDISRIFVLRCIFASDPYYFLIYTICVTIFVFTFLIRIIEGPVSTLLMDPIDYTNIQNCVWNVVVTMTTVGYGDMVPKTNLGRLFMVTASFIGNTLVSFMVVSLLNYIKFSENEAKVSN